jgi:hypothetical protein
MLKKATVLTRPTPARRDAPFRGQGRSERRVEEVQTALRVGRSPSQCVLANGKAPPAFPTSENLPLSVEALSDARTKLADFFSILLGQPGPLRKSGSLSDSPSLCIHDIPDEGVLDEKAATC